jgi:glycosyltransferase involved in cell wall biosynthesis
MLTRLNLSEPHALLAMAQALRVEVVFSHLFHADRLCAAAFGGTSIPLILTDHGDFKIVDKIGLASVDEIREVLETAHTIIATSDIGAESFARFGPDVTQRLTKIPLGVDPASPPTRAERDLRRRALGVRPGAVVFVCAARGVHEKGWSELYTVFRGASARAKTPLELWCLGAGVAIDEIKSRAILEGASNVRFFGFQRNVQDYMVAADCVVLLSKFTGETLNLSLMEAIAHGLPVIASDIGAISETVGKGAAGAGILIPISKETKAAELAAATDAMVEMADDPAVRERFAAAARRRAEMFDMRRISRQTLELMDWVLEGPRARSSTTKAG